MNNIEIDYKKPCIYMLKHKESGKFYVGSASRGLRKRLSVHKCPSNGCIKLASAIKKYGFDSFEISILEYCNIETIIQREQYYLDVLQPFDSNGYNIAKFAACPQKGRKLTEDHKQKISNSNTGKKHINRKRRPPQTNETKLKISNANKGKNRSKKQKEKCRLNRLGKTDSIESRIKKSVAQTGRKHTDESKKKMSLVQLGRKHSKESIEKMRLAKLGRKSPHSEETKIKIGIANKGKKFTEEHKQKLRDAKIGTSRSKETKKAISNTLKNKISQNIS